MSAKDRRKEAILRAAVGGTPRVVAPLPTPAKPFGYFERCYLLNLDRDRHRFERATERLRRLGVAFERFAALGPPAPCPTFADKPSLTPGLFACARSHLAILRRAMGRGEERVLIVEDDAVFRDDAADWMRRLVPQLQSVRWDVFYLGLHPVQGGGRVAENLGRAESNFHTHAYAVAKGAMAPLAEFIERSMREGFHFDCFARPGLVKVYADPILAVQGKKKVGYKAGVR